MLGVVRLVCGFFAAGPGDALGEACRHGYVPRGAYADKCHLCWSVRALLFDRGLYPSVLGPAECYDQ